MAACTETLDAGHNLRLPVDERNPVILSEDGWSGDWIGEYAVMLANTGGPRLVGIITNTTKFWMNLQRNTAGWNELVTAAEASGLKGIPSVTPSAGTALVRPADGLIDSTVPNRSDGAQLIVEVSRQMSTDARPVVVVSATSLTDIADAYLMDPTVVDRVVVVAMLGSFVAPNGVMNGPNGDMDPWADWIVAERFRYVQVSGYYDQTSDVTKGQLVDLPKNPLGDRIASKLPNIIPDLTASDQVGLLTVALPMFAVAFHRASPDTTGAFDATRGPPLHPDDNGRAWVVTQVNAPLAAARFWELLKNPNTFSH